MAGTAASVWQLAHGLHPYESVVEEGSARRVFEYLQRERIVRIKLEGVSMDSTIVKVHPDGTGALKNGPQSIGKSRGGWTTKIHVVASDARTAITFSISPGQDHDAPEGRKLLDRLGPQGQNPYLLMGRVYEGNETRQLALALGFTPIVHHSAPGSTRGSMIGRCTRSVMKSRGCSGG